MFFFIFPFLNFFIFFGGGGDREVPYFSALICLLSDENVTAKNIYLGNLFSFGTLSQSTIVTYCQGVFYVSIAERYVKVINFINITLFTAFHQGSLCLSCGFFFFFNIYLSHVYLAP